ncbi:MAG: cereblon family protein [Verrucomicrobiae bacterium]|nr:cereblon family protein [Verrucomicrobiae bacterium]
MAKSRLPALPARAMVGISNTPVGTAEPEPKALLGTGLSDPANDWLCYWCLNRVASEAERAYFNGQSEFTFRNPDGIKFHIMTFSRAPGCEYVGLPTEQYTWFPGHAWRYSVCKRCRMQLGWHYTGPTEFVGLIRDRLVRAGLVLS